MSLISSLANHLKKVKLMLLLSLKLWKWRIAANINNVGRAYDRRRRWRSFNGGDRRRGLLCGCFEQEEDDDEFENSRNVISRLQRTRTSYYNDHHSDYVDDSHYDGDDDDDYDYDDVDQRAEIFITDFRYRLLMEREVSLKLRYCEN
ncbi:cotton fiber protein [Parasponia andersonii]|uniref:Cotton fiber protein n=1 Tax=Parasponia andersonii TaxID=3476 RepID=A0A2P5DIC4_PARAD|nr:cotton fiber protein [Parasponia andersonii]